MADITKVSEITKEHIAEDIHLTEPTEKELKELREWLDNIDK